MSDFNKFKQAVEIQFKEMRSLQLFTVDVSKDELWNTYLGSFPEGTNPIFRERTEHDCNCCKQFIRTLGKTVAIVNNELVSVWDFEIEGFYQVVANAMSALVKSKSIAGVFLHDERKIGKDHNYDTDTSIVWSHFHAELPESLITRKADIGGKKSQHGADKYVFQRSMEELTLDSAEVVLDLIAQNSLYRGEEHKAIVQTFVKAKRLYDLISDTQRDNYAWVTSRSMGQGGRFKNSVIGTLLADISKGDDLEGAVRSFESKVAPTNYKRSKAIVSPRMIADAEKKVTELGLHHALPRRFAVIDDLTINNVLFADRSVKPAMGVFDEMKSEAAVSPKTFDKIEEVSIAKFMADILPGANSIELLVENKHQNNLVSLIAPIHANAPDMLKWGNNFSWSYAGEVTDSIKERVKAAGGNVEGILRCSLSWFNKDDLDIHVIEPRGNRIHFSSKYNRNTSGKLDVDMNAGGANNSVDPVENITWTDEHRMEEGVYEVFINNYSQRTTSDVGFDVEIEYDGTIHHYHHPKALGNKKTVSVAKFNYSLSGGIEIIESLPSTQATKEAWGINTNNFRKVTTVMNSPNHWDGEEAGNKHWFFMLDGCVNPDPARGFYNEFLRNDLHDHRKVFEVLSNKMKTPVSDKQLSGLGFSSTQSNSVTCRVTGTFNRIIKINF